jgi:LemA protein
MIILWILLAVVAVVVLWAIGAYNGLVRLKALLDEAWSGIDVQLKRRYDLIPNLVATVQGYSIHEKSILEEIARLRAASLGATGVQAQAVADNGLTQALKTLFAVVENYPQLKANENFMLLQRELTNVEEQLQLARRYYNGTARNYNISIRTFPTNLVAGVGNFTPSPYFETAGSHERENPQVKF